MSLRLSPVVVLVAVLATACGGYSGQRLPDKGATVPNAGAQGVTPSAAIPTSPVTDPAGTAIPSTPARSSSASSTPTGCAKIAKVSYVGFQASKKIRTFVNSFRLTLTQGASSDTAWTPADPAHPHGLPVLRGVVITSSGYQFILGARSSRDVALRGTWSPTQKATVLIEGLAGDGRSIYQRSRTFSFTTSYPNGIACDKTPAFSYFTEVTDADQISKLPKS